MCLTAKFSMAQEQWCTIGGDGHPEGSAIGGSWSPQTVHGIQGNHRFPWDPQGGFAKTKRPR